MRETIGVRNKSNKTEDRSRVTKHGRRAKSEGEYKKITGTGRLL